MKVQVLVHSARLDHLERQRSRAVWSAVNPGWYAQREELWRVSRPISEWMIRRLDPQPGERYATSRPCA
jgi:hypothetical protein